MLELVLCEARAHGMSCHVGWMDEASSRQMEIFVSVCGFDRVGHVNCTCTIARGYSENYLL